MILEPVIAVMIPVVQLDPDNPDAANSSYIVGVTDFGQDFNCNDSTNSVVLCNFVQMAQDDIFNWKESLKNSLPNNSGTTASIDVLPKTPGTLPTATVTITINWQERNQETQTMDTMSYSVSAHICDNTKC